MSCRFIPKTDLNIAVPSRQVVAVTVVGLMQDW